MREAIMRSFYIGATVLALLLVPIGMAAGSSAIETKSLELSAEGIQKMEIKCGAGFLKVSGMEGLSSIKVEAKIDVSGISRTDLNKFIEDHVTLTLTKEGELAVLESKANGHLTLGEYCKIDLTVQLPKNLSLAIADGSGYIEIADLSGNLEIADGSGEITAKNIGGNVNISDGSGDITVVDVRGDLNISDGSDDIDVRNISGNVNLTDGSGAIYIDGVEKDVSLNAGTIYKNGVERDVKLKSGNITIKNVKGKVNR